MIKRFIKAFKETWNESNIIDKIDFVFRMIAIILIGCLLYFSYYFISLVVKVMLKYLAS